MTQTAMTVTTEERSLVARIGERYNMEPHTLYDTLQQTVFKGATKPQMVALLLVADQYLLNPFLKEIFAFPDKSGGIVPVVGVDGWSRIINDHPQFDGMEFSQDDKACTCIIYRKDRSHTVQVTEYMSECVRNTAAWQSHPKRMLRHKSIIQCARIAFGFTGIVDKDEAERIQENMAIELTPLIEMPTKKLESFEPVPDIKGRTEPEPEPEPEPIMTLKPPKAVYPEIPPPSDDDAPPEKIKTVKKQPFEAESSTNMMLDNPSPKTEIPHAVTVKRIKMLKEFKAIIVGAEGPELWINTLAACGHKEGEISDLPESRFNILTKSITGIIDSLNDGKSF